MPGAVPAATVYAMLACVAVQPMRLDGGSGAVSPSGTGVIDSRTRSKNVVLRPTVIGRTPPSGASTLGGVAVVVLMLNVPSAQMRDTSSNGSCVESGSVEVAQLKLPR